MHPSIDENHQLYNECLKNTCTNRPPALLGTPQPPPAPMTLAPLPPLSVVHLHVRTHSDYYFVVYIIYIYPSHFNFFIEKQLVF